MSDKQDLKKKLREAIDRKRYKRNFIRTTLSKAIYIAQRERKAIYDKMSMLLKLQADLGLTDNETLDFANKLFGKPLPL